MDVERKMSAALDEQRCGSSERKRRKAANTVQILEPQLQRQFSEMSIRKHDHEYLQGSLLFEELRGCEEVRQEALNQVQFLHVSEQSTGCLELPRGSS